MTTVESKPGRARLLIMACLFVVTICSFVSCNSRSSNNTSPKFQQYYVQGEQLYLQYCSNCHQKDGSGLGLLYPPLDTSDFMHHHLEDVVCLIRNGKQGSLVVNGREYNQAMPALGISDLEIAEIATYIYNTWSHQEGLLDVKFVSEVLTSCDSLAMK